MASPFFFTGANAKIKVNNRTMAFCTDLSYSINIKTIAPKILGMYEAHTMEPLSYDVSGSFTVIRYARGLKGEFEKAGKKVPDGVSESGNGLGALSPQGLTFLKGGVGAGAAQLTGLGDTGGAHEHLNPKYLSSSSMFDIEVYQKTGLKRKLSALENFIKDAIKDDVNDPLTKGFASGINTFFGEKSELLLCGMAKIRDCRIERADFKLTKKGAAIQTFTFKAAYVDEDSFNADFSGAGQHFGT